MGVTTGFHRARLVKEPQRFRVVGKILGDHLLHPGSQRFSSWRKFGRSNDGQQVALHLRRPGEFVRIPSIGRHGELRFFIGPHLIVRECLLVNIGGIFAGGWLEVPLVEFDTRCRKPRVMDCIDSCLNAECEAVAVNEV